MELLSGKHLEYYLGEYTFRFNRRTSRSRGMLFYTANGIKMRIFRGEARVHLLRPSLIFAPARAKHDEAVLSPLQKQNRICMPFEVYRLVEQAVRTSPVTFRQIVE